MEFQFTKTKSRTFLLTFKVRIQEFIKKVHILDWKLRLFPLDPCSHDVVGETSALQTFTPVSAPSSSLSSLAIVLAFYK